jgi:hypothetical protein
MRPQRTPAERPQRVADPPEEQRPQMKTPREKLSFALERYPEQIELVPLEELVVESARQNDRRPAYLKIAVPDQLVKELRGGKGERDLLMLVRVPKDVLKRSESRIVLPGEVR